MVEVVDVIQTWLCCYLEINQNIEAIILSLHVKHLLRDKQIQSGFRSVFGEKRFPIQRDEIIHRRIDQKMLLD